MANRSAAAAFCIGLLTYLIGRSIDGGLLGGFVDGVALALLIGSVVIFALGIKHPRTEGNTTWWRPSDEASE